MSCLMYVSLASLFKRWQLSSKSEEIVNADLTLMLNCLRVPWPVKIILFSCKSSIELIKHKCQLIRYV